MRVYLVDTSFLSASNNWFQSFAILIIDILVSTRLVTLLAILVSARVIAFIGCIDAVARTSLIGSQDVLAPSSTATASFASQSVYSKHPSAEKNSQNETCEWNVGSTR